MRCPACGGETPADKRFCANCGTALPERACPACGAELLAGKPFCADCGASVAVSTDKGTDTAGGLTPGSLARTESPVAERRICSVLFVDLVGFTPLAEHRDPEEIRELLSTYFDRAQTIVGHYGGTIEKFIGDAVMAVWGAPVANEDDAERAVRAGLEVVASVSALGVEVGIPELAARGGIVTGETAVTIGRLSEGMILGDTVNAASRVQSVAEPRTVFVDDATWRATAEAIAYAEVGELSLKGKSERVHAWRALRVVARRRGVGRSEGLEPPFVGRDTDLQLVKDLLHATMRERRARLVSVTGVPGIGKSRLAWEFVKYVDGLADVVYWHQGRSPAYGDGVTFWALGEMVRMRADISEGDDRKTASAKLAVSLEEFVADREERTWIGDRLAYLLGLTDDVPAGDREELFSAWRRFFERVAEAGPAVMVFEDLQWADHGLVDFVESILEWSANHAMMVITLARPELVDRRPTWGAGQRNFTSLHLDPLPPDAMGQLLGGFVRNLPDSVATQIVDRCEGVPLYAVEIVRSLVDGGVLVEGDGAYAVVGDLASLEVPETLHALIGSRLDALPLEQRSLLQDAAVLGTSFSAESLASMQGIDQSKLDADLRDLVRKEFLVLDNDPRSPERGHYSFVQALIREVAISRLARRDRSSKHLAVARYFEALNDEELTAAVAAHYLEGLRTAPEGAEASAIAAQARHWLVRAGDRALSLGSPEQALGFFRQALEVEASPSDRTSLLESASEAAIAVGAEDAAAQYLTQAIALHRELGDANAAATDTARLASALAGDRRLSEAVELVLPAFEASDDLDESVRSLLACELANAYSHSGERETALGWSETALRLAERCDDSQLFARALGSKSLTLFHLGRHREAVILARGMAAIAETGGALREQATALTGLSVYALQDDPRESQRAGSHAAEIARRAGQRQIEITNLLNNAETSAYIGDWHEAAQALDELRQKPLNLERTWWSGCIQAVMLAGSGHGTEALDLLESFADGQGPESQYISMRSTHLCARGFVLLCSDELARARAAASEGAAADPLGINALECYTTAARASVWQRDADAARSTLVDMGNFRGRYAAAVRLAVSAGVAALDGDRAQALDGFRRAREAWNGLDCPLPLALSQLDEAIVLGPEAGEGIDFDEARSILTTIGASALLDRLNRATSRV